MISVEDALARVLALGQVLPVERVALRQAAGRSLAAPVVARLTQPPFDASAMDGYAIREADHRAGAVLAVIGEAGAGHAFAGQVAPGEAVRIFTGAPVPAGAGRVVLQEDVTRDGDSIRLGTALETGRHIRPRGQDFRQGDSLTAPRRLTPYHLALAAAMNVPDLEVRRRPDVAILSTGDELVMPGETPRPDQIVASNGLALAAMAEAAGATARLLPIAPDERAALRLAFELAAGADIVVTIGGASVGDHDLINGVAQELGLEQNFWKVAMRPGKPLIAGRLNGAVLLGLPGNPVSALVTARLFLLPLIDRMLGLPAGHDTRPARLALAVPPNGPRAHYMRARTEDGDGNGPPLVTPVADQDSALLRLLTEADTLIVRPPGDPARAAGELVDTLRL